MGFESQRQGLLKIERLAALKREEELKTQRREEIEAKMRDSGFNTPEFVILSSLALNFST